MHSSLEKPQTPVGKKVPARNARVVHAPHPSARSHPCPCPGGSAPRYPAPPRPPSRTLMLVTTAQPRRARLSRFRSFPASRGWKENGKRLVTDSAGRFLVRARGRGGAGWSRRRGRARGDGWTSSPRASRARSGRTLVRDPASRARARRRPSAFAAGSAKNDDADARERMTFEMRGGCRAYRRSRDRRARVHACAPFP